MSKRKFIDRYANRPALIIIIVSFSLVSLRCLDPCPSCSSAPTGPISFVQTGPLNEDRAEAAAQPIPLTDTVLVAGGGRFAGYLTRSQIFDPVQNTVANDAELIDARANQTATLLKDGTVLLTGGDNGNIALNSAEVYHPGKSKFVQPGSMFAPRTHHTATLLKNGRVLIAGGSPAVQQVQLSNGTTEAVPNGANNSAELYDPSTGAFLGAFQAMVSARTEHTATLLNDGTVLLTGGLDENGVVLATAEIFDPKTQSFAPTGNLNFARYAHTATLIQCDPNECSINGFVLIVGGLDGVTATDNSTNNAELYDPGTHTFAPLKDSKNGRAFHTAIGFPDGSVLIAGGLSGHPIPNIPSGGFTNLNTAELFTTNTTAGSMITLLSATMSNPRSGLMAAAYNNNSMVLLAFGGEADFNGDYPEFTNSNPGIPGTLASTDIYDPAHMSFASGPSSPQTCPHDLADNPQGCAISRAAYTATTLTNGKILLAGGYEAIPVTFESAEVYDFGTGMFTETATPMHEPRVFASAAQFTNPVTNSSGILVAGGMTGNENTNCDGTAELYQQGSFALSSGKMGTTSSNSHRCEFSTATMLANGQVLLAGGVDGTDTVLSSAEIYDPMKDTFVPTAGSMMTARWGQSAALLSDGTVLITGGESCFPCPSDAPPDDLCRSSSNPCPSDNEEFLSSAEIFNPAMGGSFSPTSGAMLRQRFFGTATRLNQPVNSNPGASVLLAGGSGDNVAELYDPSTGMFGPTRSMQAIRFFDQATPLGNNLDFILISGGSGRNGFGSLATLNSAEIFIPGNNQFCPTANMIDSRAFHAAAPGQVNGAMRIVVAGGLGDNTSLGSAELYVPPTSVSTSCAISSPMQTISDARSLMMAARDGLVNVRRQISEKRVPQP